MEAAYEGAEAPLDADDLARGAVPSDDEDGPEEPDDDEDAQPPGGAESEEGVGAHDEPEVGAAATAAVINVPSGPPERPAQLDQLKMPQVRITRRLLILTILRATPVHATTSALRSVRSPTRSLPVSSAGSSQWAMEGRLPAARTFSARSSRPRCSPSALCCSLVHVCAPRLAAHHDGARRESREQVFEQQQQQQQQ